MLVCWAQDLLLVATRSAVFVLAVLRLGKRSRSFLANVEHTQDVYTKYRVVRRGYDISGMGPDLAIKYLHTRVYVCERSRYVETTAFPDRRSC